MEFEISVWVSPKQSILHLNYFKLFIDFENVMHEYCLSNIFGHTSQVQISCVLSITSLNFITSYFVIIIFLYLCVCVYACIHTCIWKYYVLSTFTVVHKYIFMVDHLELYKQLSGYLSLEKTDSPSFSRQYLQVYGEDF